MIPKRITVLLVSTLLVTFTAVVAQGQTDTEIERLIDKLQETVGHGYGYSSSLAGSQFIPYADSDHADMFVFGGEPSERSPAIETLVRMGARAIPALLKHLDDQRQTKVPPLSGTLWVTYDDEYDFNSRTRKEAPEGVNRSFSDPMRWKNPLTHSITVGDLCFVALGQIVNRNFNATRYQRTGGMVVSSPTYSKKLCAVVRKDFEHLTGEEHRKLLIEDFRLPDHGGRLIGAYLRLALYYPDDVEPMVLDQLKIPAYNIHETYSFIHGTLYPEKDNECCKQLFDGFVRDRGHAYRDGILVLLFRDLDSQEADEQHRLFPPLEKKYNARNLLILLYGYPKEVKGQQEHYVSSWSTSERAWFVEALVHDPSKRIDAVVNELLVNTDDDSLALACMKRLMDRGYDKEIEAYCARRIPKSEHWADRLTEVLNQLRQK